MFSATTTVPPRALASPRTAPGARRNAATQAVKGGASTTVQLEIEAKGGMLIPGCYDALSARVMATQRYRVGLSCPGVCVPARGLWRTGWRSRALPCAQRRN